MTCTVILLPLCPEYLMHKNPPFMAYTVGPIGCKD